MIHTASFHGHEYRFQEGSVHPAYSLECFTADESDFRDKYWNPKAGQTVIDVGASYGAYALTAAACGANVVAFEPEPTVFVDLKANNDLNGGKMVLICAGLADIFRVGDMRSYAPHWPTQAVSTPYVMAPLDEFELERVDWLKVDVEGLEPLVLVGARNIIGKHKPTLIVECHIFMDKTLTDVCKELIGEGYDFEVAPRDPCEMLIARPK